MGGTGGPQQPHLPQGVVDDRVRQADSRMAAPLAALPGSAGAATAQAPRGAQGAQGARAPGATGHHDPRRGVRGRPLGRTAHPSGHAVIPFGMAVLLAPYLRRRWQVVVLALAVANGVARVHLGAHAPSTCWVARRRARSSPRFPTWRWGAAGPGPTDHGMDQERCHRPRPAAGRCRCRHAAPPVGAGPGAQPGRSGAVAAASWRTSRASTPGRPSPRRPGVPPPAKSVSLARSCPWRPPHGRASPPGHATRWTAVRPDGRRSS
jgi:PAP2 superfamily